uniref:Putative til domain protein n=1 Tax=Ixodes ricinus TaxID=34613 RepID=A0A0K8RJI4_IXORI
MKFLALAFLVCVLALVVAQKKKDEGDKDAKEEDDTPKCGAWEVWRCASTNCSETTCELPTLGHHCAKDCEEGCFCDDGFFRDDLGNCVTWDHCTRE